MSWYGGKRWDELMAEHATGKTPVWVDPSELWDPIERETHPSLGWEIRENSEGNLVQIYTAEEPAWQLAESCEPEGDSVYLIHAPDLKLVKIGVTRDVAKRLRALRGGSPCELRLLKRVDGDRNLEAKLHTRFASFRRHHEWFDDAVLGEWDAAMTDLREAC